MDKLLLTLTLVAFSSGVLCNVVPNPNSCGNSEARCIGQVSREQDICQLCSKVEPGNGFTVFEGFGAYKLHKCKKDWNDARISCRSEKGQLAIINSNEEATMLKNWMGKENIDDIWIGIHGYFKGNEWVTMTGDSVEAAGYDNWSNGEPNNVDDNEYCGSLEQTGGLNDLTCSLERAYICKIYMCADLLL